jgi:hypothetical protein
MSGILRKYRVSTTARPIEFFLDGDAGDPRFDMGQPYQRGVVWGAKRRQNLIKSILMGVPVPAIVINNRLSAGFSHPGYSQDRNWMYAVVDGKQRVTTVRGFVNNEFRIPHEWVEDGAPGRVCYGDLPLTFQRGFRHASIPVVEGQFVTLDQERELFELVNFGGLAQGEVDDDLIHAAKAIARDKEME